MKKYTAITLVLIVGLVFGITGITSVQQADAVAKSKCKGDTYDGVHFKIWKVNPAPNSYSDQYNVIDACVAEGWTIGQNTFFYATKK